MKMCSFKQDCRLKVYNVVTRNSSKGIFQLQFQAFKQLITTFEIFRTFLRRSTPESALEQYNNTNT